MSPTASKLVDVDAEYRQPTWSLKDASTSREAKTRYKKAADANKASIFDAAKTGDLNTVKYWIEEKGTDVNIKDTGTGENETPLLIAAKYGQLAVVKYLVEKNADVTAKTQYGKGTPLHLAVKNGHLPVIKYLVEEKGVDINSNISYGNSLLHLAFEINQLKTQLDVIKYLVGERKADVNAKNVRDVTPLYLATESGTLDVVKYLVENGANVNEKETDEGFSPLHVASGTGHLDLVKYFVEDKGIDVNIRSNHGYTPLIWAANSGETEIAKFLIGEKKADVSLKNQAGFTALHSAAERGVLALVKYLITDGKAVVNVKDILWGDSPVHKAAKSGYLDVVKYLAEEAGADMNTKNDDGETLLHGAARQGGNTDLVKYLVTKWKADVNATTSKGDTPLHYATSSNELNVVKCLVDDLKADINAKNNAGKSPLEVARAKGYQEIAQYLEAAGKTRSKRAADDSKSEDYSTNGPHFAISSASRSSSFISGVFFWLTNSVSGFLLPSPSQVRDSVTYPDVKSSAVNGLLILLDVGVRKFWGNNYKQPVHDSLLSPKELLQRRIDPIALSVVSVDNKSRSSGRLRGISFQDKCVAQPPIDMNGVLPQNVCVNGVDILSEPVMPYLPINI